MTSRVGRKPLAAATRAAPTSGSTDHTCEIKSLGVDAVPGEVTDLDRAWLTRKLKMYDLLPAKGVDHFKKIVAGKQLWNYDNLEPTEKKLIL